MSESPVPALVIEAMQQRQRRRKRFKRRVIIAAVLLPILLIGAVIAGFFYLRHVANRELEAAIAETDKLDPGWRLEEILVRRAQVTAEENAAIPVSRAAAMIPTNWWPSAKELEWLDTLHPVHQLDPASVPPLRKVVTPYLPALTLAQESLSLKKSFYRIAWTDDGLSTLIPHTQEVRNLIYFLTRLAMLQAHDGQYDLAWKSAVTGLAVSATLGDEPTLISQLVRMFGRTIAIESMERCLAQGNVDDSLLAEAQKLLMDEAPQPLLWHGLRGERAIMDRFLTSWEEGTVPGQQKFFADDRLTTAKLLLQGNTIKGDHAWFLRYSNDCIAASQLPPKEMLQTIKDLQGRIKSAPMLIRNIVPASHKVAEASVRSIVRLHCAAVGIGVERFRMKNGRWPDSLDDVVAAKLLDKVPEDPYVGKPLQYRKVKDGIVIFSVGPKENYQGDALDIDPTFSSNITRYDFRLWDEPHRRQPPVPRPPDDEDKKGG